MFPPVEDTVLKNNPDFAALHKTLTTMVLSPNGATKNDPVAKERAAVQLVNRDPSRENRVLSSPN